MNAEDWPLIRRHHMVEHMLDEAGTALETADSSTKETRGQEAQDRGFRGLLAASAVSSIAAGEAPREWEHRQTRRWGAPDTVHQALEAARTCLDAPGDSSLRLLVAGFGETVPHRFSSDPRTDVPNAEVAFPHSVWAGIADVDFAPRLVPSAPRCVGATARLMISLPHAQRGAHMSRLQETVVSAEERTFGSTLECARWLAADAAAGQPSSAVKVVLRSRHKSTIAARFSGRPSSIVFDVEHDVRSCATEEVIRSALTIGVMTVCPCTLKYSQLVAEEAVGTEAAAMLPPTFSHSQPGWLTVEAEGRAPLVPAEHVLLDVCGQVAHLRESVLKRPDEHDLVERAHRRPQFVEDLCRSAAAALASRTEGDVEVRAEATLAESIHPHRAEAAVGGPARSFWAAGG